jgi:hypothetical protein
MKVNCEQFIILPKLKPIIGKNLKYKINTTENKINPTENKIESVREERNYLGL